MLFQRSIAYVVGDATAPIGKGPRTIVHVCNDGGGWGRGFVLAVSKRWREPEEQYRRWSQGGGTKPFALGEVEHVLVEPELWVANLVGQHGTRPKEGVAPVRYDAIRAGLATVRDFARLHSSTVHMPRIGAGLAGGRWEEIESIVKEELVDHDVAVVVYDLPTTTG